MRAFPRPAVVVSECLEFADCRYNGQQIACPVVKQLKPFVDFRPVCPEMGIGLGVPREPIRVIEGNGRRSLCQPATGRDLTDEMNGFAARHLESVGDIDGFILKSRSPSCGIKDVMIYPGAGFVPPARKGAGFFGTAVLERFSHLAVEDDGRLENPQVRGHYFTRLYALADFRQVRMSGELKKLVDYQSRQKLMLMAYNQREMHALGRIVANEGRRPWGELTAEYGSHLGAALSRLPRPAAHVNVLQHALGYFKDGLSAAEREFFLDELTRYRRGKLPLGAVIDVMRSWIARFGSEYLGLQSYFEPYPGELSEPAGAGRGREPRRGSSADV
jgi:uncharacterized protein YbgA (DUF1722 family)/uncharacterized protein YbbK (DUF523 family)